MPTLFDPLQLGPSALKNRIFMAPMTRGRAEMDGTPTAIMPTYYLQRASAGLLITEGTNISPQAVGWVGAPGIWTEGQQAAWVPVTQAVHQVGGHIYLQLWHMGRVSHPDFLDGELPVGPSAIAAEGQSGTPQGPKPYVQPRALAADELPGIAQDYARAAVRAIAAGFDGVEIHGANGYLVDQFIRSRSNQRSDAFGGSIEKRWAFPLMVVDAVVAAIGADRVGIRVSPTGTYNGMGDEDPVASYRYGALELEKRDLAYVHVVEPLPGHMMATPGAPAVLPVIREAFKGLVIANGGHGRESGDALLAQGLADAVSFGVPFLCSPDLPARFQEGAPLNPPDFSTLYVGGEKGYTDYPALGA